ncbi:hypothetical protein LVB87_00765 [Lysobacter sp. KIS68-7]|uniref:hypothetical protein n=1 Tax=Lysobacter sp. KIS68-7 TaxID=2904252 RepID=UPI001E3108C1|nr:hypothetical protein [Lysobacter sp. KIS68-7]UHQ19735.1 hypothetical protein LVB87_00765 [Lysobacter sp. KIS68-7]
MSFANALLTAAGVLGVTFFFCFFRFITRSHADQRLLLKKSKPGKVVNLLTALPAIALVFGPPQYRIFAAVAFLASGLVLGFVQHRWLRANGAQPQFVNGLRSVSLLSFLALAAFSAAMVLGA